MRLSPLLFRRIHKWVGLVIGVQFVIWTISGALMAVLDMETVAGGPRPAAVKPRALPFSTAGWPAVGRSLGSDPVTALTVRPLLARHVIEVGTPRGIRLFDGASGHRITIDAAMARRLAQAGYAGAGAVRDVRLLTERTLAIREHSLPVWRVDFADGQNSSFYVSQTTGELLERRNDTWRVWDFVWMLHNMDYLNRTSFNHPLIVIVGFGAVWLAITGLYLLFKTSWRPELRLSRRMRKAR
ncbi:MAG TPA: PepSY domain-containing protein [Allosphingosinicella sp.]